VGVSRDCPNFLSTPVISGTGKATNFKFCMYILTIDRKKSPLQISGKIVGSIVRTLKTFQCSHILGASRGLLCGIALTRYMLCIMERCNGSGAGGCVVRWVDHDTLKHEFHITLVTEHGQ